MIPPGLGVNALGAYDLITRRRLHPAHVAVALLIFALQLTATALYLGPWWKPAALKLLGQ